MKIGKTTAAWAVTGALGLATFGGGAFAVLTSRPTEENRPGIILDSSTVTPSGRPTAPASADSPETPTSTPPRTSAPVTTKKATTTQQTTVKRTTRYTTTRKPTVKRTTYQAPAPVSADSPQSADSG